MCAGCAGFAQCFGFEQEWFSMGMVVQCRSCACFTKQFSVFVANGFRVNFVLVVIWRVTVMFLCFRVVVRCLRFTRAGSHWCAKLEFQGGSGNIWQNFGGI